MRGRVSSMKILRVLPMLMSITVHIVTMDTRLFNPRQDQDPEPPFSKGVPTPPVTRNPIVDIRDSR